jgi:hypothetical protein
MQCQPNEKSAAESIAEDYERKYCEAGNNHPERVVGSVAERENRL